jgi:hypothetical protein
MIYADRLHLKSIDAAVIFETDTTVTLFIDSDPVLHGVRDCSTLGRPFDFYRIQDERYVDNPSIIREALNYVTDEFIGIDVTWTDDEYKALPMVRNVDADVYTLE